METRLSNNKFDELLCDSQFFRTLLALKTTEEVKKLFSENGVILDDCDVYALGSILFYLVEQSGELSDAQLGAITGGVGMKYNKDSGWNAVLEHFCNLIPESKNRKLTGDAYWYPSIVKIGKKAVSVAGIVVSILVLKEAKFNTAPFWINCGGVFAGIIGLIN